MSLKENGVVSFNTRDNGKFFSKLADLLLYKLPRQKNKFGIKTIEGY